MSSWIYSFSQFTDPLLVFEGLTISFLIIGYAAYFILKRRKSGIIGKEIPGEVVQEYLNYVIDDADSVRNQLFGLDGNRISAGSRPQVQYIQEPAAIIPSENSAVPSVNAAVVEATAKHIVDDAALAELQKRVSGLETENTDLKSQLEKAKSATPAAAAGGGGADAAKVKELEERLAEYSIIEDDLANLKRLQQENDKLKKQLEAGGGAPAEEAAAPAEETAAVEEAPEKDEPPSLEAAPAETSSDFDDLVDQVEESLQADDGGAESLDGMPVEDSDEPPAAEEVVAQELDAAAEAAPTEAVAEEAAADENPAPTENAAPAVETAEAKAEESSDDEDLLAEFERMLNM